MHLCGPTREQAHESTPPRPPLGKLTEAGRGPSESPSGMGVTKEVYTEGWKGEKEGVLIT